MKQKWQESRNYRRFKDENGEVVRRVITVDEQDVEVSEEVFLAYSQAERRERYIEETERDKVVSLNKLLEEKVALEKYTRDRVETVEEILLQQEEKSEVDRLKRLLPEVMAELNDEERKLICSIFFEGVSVREYAKQYGWCHQTVPYKRDRALAKLKKLFFRKNLKIH